MKRRTYESEEGWLLSYADLLTNLVIYFAVIMGAAQMSRSQLQEIGEELSGVEQPESLSSIQRQVTEQTTQQGRFAATFRADNGNTFSNLNRQVKIIEQRSIFKTLAQTLHFQCQAVEFFVQLET